MRQKRVWKSDIVCDPLQKGVCFRRKGKNRRMLLSELASFCPPERSSSLREFPIVRSDRWLAFLSLNAIHLLRRDLMRGCQDPKGFYFADGGCIDDEISIVKKTPCLEKQFHLLPCNYTIAYWKDVSVVNACLNPSDRCAHHSLRILGREEKTQYFRRHRPLKRVCAPLYIRCYVRLF